MPDVSAAPDSGDSRDSSDADATDGTDNSGAEVDVAEPWCNFDCWPFVQCRSGLVEAAAGGFWDGPCQYQPDHCPAPRQHACPGACAIPTRCDHDLSYECGDDDSCDLEQLCASSQPGRVGDACASDGDCRWTCAPTEPIGRLYQVCDPATHLCAAVPPPPSEPFAIGCGLTTADLPFVLPLTGGLVVDGVAACPTGLCVAAAGQSDASCFDQACTRVCDGDDAGPEGTWCVEVQGPGGAIMSVCAPPRGGWPAGCP